MRIVENISDNGANNVVILECIPSFAWDLRHPTPCWIHFLLQIKTSLNWMSMNWIYKFNNHTMIGFLWGLWHLLGIAKHFSFSEGSTLNIMYEIGTFSDQHWILCMNLEAPSSSLINCMIYTPQKSIGNGQLR